MKKVNVSVNEMVEAVKANGKEPWNVVGMGRRTWFRNLSENGVTMVELRASSEEKEQVQPTKVPVRTIRPVPQWEPNVTNEANTVGRGGVRVLNRKLSKLEIKMCEFVINVTSELDEVLSRILSRVKYEHSYFSKVLELGK